MSHLLTYTTFLVRCVQDESQFLLPCHILKREPKLSLTKCTAFQSDAMDGALAVARQWLADKAGASKEALQGGQKARAASQSAIRAQASKISNASSP